MSNEKKNVNVEETAKKQSFLEKNWKMLCAVLVGIGVIIGGYYGYKKLIVEPKEESANVMLASCQDLFNQGNFEQALKGDGKECKGLLAVVNQYGGTCAGNLANAYAGVCYYNLQKYDDAIKSLEAFDVCDDTSISPAAIAALGNCYACKNQNDKAVEKLLQAANKANSSALSPGWLVQAGEIYEFGLNNKEKALECYNKVKNDFPLSMQASMIDAYIERASVK